MIEKLTKEQELRIPEVINKWVNKASEPIDKEKAILYTKKIYKSMNEKEPIIIFGSSPLNTCLLASLFSLLIKNKDNYLQLRSQLDSQLHSQLDSQLYSQLHSQLGSQLHSQLDSQLRSQLDLQLDSQLRLQLYSQLRSQLNSQLDLQLDSQVHSQLHSQLREQLSSQLYSKLYLQLYLQLRSQLNSQLDSINNDWYFGIYWLVWCGWYEYGKSIGVNLDNKTYDLFINFTSEVNFIIPYKNIAFISEKPTKINWENNLLHKDGGLAVEYSDGYGIYCLNGVRVPEYLAMTPESELDIEFFKKEKNADVKAEFIRKYGIDRMKHLGKVVDSWENYKTNEWWVKSEYELVDMSAIFESIDYAPHLCMKNQTTGTYHLEGVDPSCRTVEDAIKFRWNNRTNQYKTEEIR